MCVNAWGIDCHEATQNTCVHSRYINSYIMQHPALYMGGIMCLKVAVQEHTPYSCEEKRWFMKSSTMGKQLLDDFDKLYYQLAAACESLESLKAAWHARRS
eukprot:5845003-Amphidinium_carterae.2